MRLFIQAEEGADHALFLGADTDFNIALTDRDGLPAGLDGTKYAVLQLFASNNRDSALVKNLIVTPVSGKESSGLGTISVLDTEAVLTRKQYFVWALHDDGTGDSGKLSTAPTITNAGLGYEANPTIAVDNTGTGGTLGALTAVIKGGVKSLVTITNGGSGYTTAPSVTFNTPPGGVAAAGTATVSGGIVTGVTITSPGSGYTVANPPVITFGGPGTLAAATAKINGVITTLTTSVQGSGYKFPPALTVSPSGGETITTTALVAVPVLHGVTQISQTPSSLTLS